MKKYIFTLAALALSFSYATAQNLYVDEVVEVPQGGQAAIAIKYETGGYDLKALQFKLELPTGITVGTNSSNKTYDGVDANYEDFSYTYNDNGWNAFSASTAFSADTEGKGTFMYIYLAADESLEPNTTHVVWVRGPMVSRVVDGTSEAYYLDDFKFTIKIVDYILLDETSMVLPSAASGVTVKVKRTIKANEWSTICFPFDMWADQVEEVFGAEAKFAMFTSYTKDGGTPSTKETKTAQSIKLNFTTQDWVADDGIFANTPYLVKSAKDVDEFSLEDVEISPNGNVDAQVKTNGTSGRVCGHFYGTQSAGKYVPENGLFLNGGNFYYSKGLTKIKGFRGYFVLNDILADIASAGVKMQVNVDGTTVIEGIPEFDTLGSVYTVDGKFMGRDINTSKLQKGIYIINGKKVAVK